MIQFEEAIARIASVARQYSPESEVIPLEEADGRICTEDILSPEAVPSFNNSAMDGFAICSEDTLGASEENPVRLSVSSIAAAGDEVVSYSSDVRAIEIMTGAALPDIFDAVVKIEDVKILRSEAGGGHGILISSFIPKGNNVREKGEDYKVGQIVLSHGACIRAESMMALAGLGISEVTVFKKPVVSILSTGKELVPLETKSLKPGRIRNSTALYLKTAMAHLGARIHSVETIGDEVGVFKDHVQRNLAQNIDVLVTTGAVSMGKYDFIVPALLEMGAEIVFHKVAIRPGKPILFAKIKRSRGNPLIIFGMPGNPIASAVGFRFFLTPFFREFYGQHPEQAWSVKLSETTRKPENLKCFFKARLEKEAGDLVVRSLAGQASFMISPLVQANAWVLFPEVGTQVSKNQRVDVFPLLQNEFFEWGNL
ncbi:MAG TPA: gephyrin-like molybdotransferase Glp [Pseudobdellovibrionaceae bacterium]